MSQLMPKSRTDAVRIMIVDDHPLIRDGLRMRIEQEEDLTVCGEAADVGEALKVAADSQPQVAIVDISLKKGNGLDLIKRILSHDSSVKVIVSSMHDENIYAERAFRAGALGYVHKDESSDRIVEAIRSVLSDRLAASEKVMQQIVGRSIGRNGQKDAGFSAVDRLTDRELEVLQRIGQGYKVARIAEDMNLSPKTVETYRDRIRVKLDISTSHKLQHFAFRWVADHNE